MILTPAICDALFPKGEVSDVCPFMIKGINETPYKDKQSYFETRLFGSNSYGDVVNKLPFTSKGNVSSAQKKIDSVVSIFDKLCESEGILIEDNYQEKISVPFRSSTLQVVLNVFPTSFIVDGNMVIGGVNFFIVSNLNHPYSKRNWENVLITKHVEICTTLYILNEIRDGYESVVKMAKRKQIHLMYWVVDLGKDVNQLKAKIVPSDNLILEGKEYFRKAESILKDTSWDKIPSYSACSRCKLKCDKRVDSIIIY